MQSVPWFFAASPTPRRGVTNFPASTRPTRLGLRRRAAGDGKARGNYRCGAELAQVFLAAAHAAALVGAVGQQLFAGKVERLQKCRHRHGDGAAVVGVAQHNGVVGRNALGQGGQRGRLCSIISAVTWLTHLR